MNERDMLLMQKINSMLGPIKDMNKILFTVRYTQLTRLNLILLKLFLNERKWNGILIVLDRPHQYISHLLHLHNVNQENLSYIDTVSSLSGFEQQQNKNVSFVEDPFRIENLLNSFDIEKDDDIQEKPIDMDKINFILLDNVSKMLRHNEIYQIKDFVTSFTSILNNYDSLFLVVTIDRNAHKQLYEILKRTSNFDKEIELMKEW